MVEGVCVVEVSMCVVEGSMCEGDSVCGGGQCVWWRAVCVSTPSHPLIPVERYTGPAKEDRRGTLSKHSIQKKVRRMQQTFVQFTGLRSKVGSFIAVLCDDVIMMSLFVIDYRSQI